VSLGHAAVLRTTAREAVTLLTSHGEALSSHDGRSRRQDFCYILHRRGGGLRRHLQENIHRVCGRKKVVESCLLFSQITYRLLRRVSMVDRPVPEVR